MSQNPVGGIPDPFGYRAEGSGSRQSGPEGPPNEPPDNKGIIGYLLQAMQRALNALLERFGKTENSSKETSLNTLKSFLDLLKAEDRSQDVHFLNDLSKSWNQALEESLAFKEEASLIFKIFVKKILHYPENQVHTFGYYLTEYAGQKWIPFPYMELVQKLHREHEKSPSTSSLTEWTRLLEDAIRLLQRK